MGIAFERKAPPSKKRFKSVESSALDSTEVALALMDGMNDTSEMLLEMQMQMEAMSEEIEALKGGN